MSWNTQFSASLIAFPLSALVSKVRLARGARAWQRLNIIARTCQFKLYFQPQRPKNAVATRALLLRARITKKRKREKKGRKALKKAKDQEKALKLKAKADDASKKKRKILAAKFLSKLEPALLALESNLCSGSSESLSPLVKNAAADALAKIKKAKLDVKATNDDPSTELAYESEYINQLVSNAKKANAVVTSALASVARFNL